MTLHEQGDMCADVEKLLKEYRSMREELFTLRPLARLATVISLMEGETQRLFKDLEAANRDYEELRNLQRKLALRIDALEQGRTVNPPPGGGMHP
jgi:uncharacterized protein YhaN